MTIFKHPDIGNMLRNEKVKIAFDLANGYWNDKYVNIIDELLTDETIIESPVKLTIGRNNFKEIITSWLIAFPNLQYKEKEIIFDNEKNRIVSRWTAKGNHMGMFFGIPATGQYIEYGGTTFFTVIEKKVINYYADVNIHNILIQIDKKKADILKFELKKGSYLIENINRILGVKLSIRHIECLSLFVLNLTQKKIARLLGIEASTVKTHLIRAMHIMRIHEHENIIDYFISINLLEIFINFGTKLLIFLTKSLK